MKTLVLTFIVIVLCSFKTEAQEKGDPPKVAHFIDRGAVVGLHVKPEFPGGINAFYNSINKNFRIPDIKKNLSATINVSFVIEKDGTMSSYKVLRDPGYGLGDELLRVLKLIKEKWTPGMQNDKPVRTAQSLPLTINIKD